MTTGTYTLVLFIWNVAPVVNVVYTGLSPFSSGVLYISDITQYFDHLKSAFISQLINDKSRNIQKLL